MTDLSPEPGPKPGGDYPPALIEALKLLQGIINRMAASSLEMKKFAMGVAGIGLAAAFNTQHGAIIPLLVIFTLIFWVLDVKYLQQERWFRKIYDQKLKDQSARETPFAFTPGREIRESVSFGAVFMSWSTAWFYLALLFVLVIAGAMFLCRNFNPM